MESLTVKIFATALALSQVATEPESVQTSFDRARDQPQVAQLLHAGCTHMRKALDIESIDLEELMAIALDDPQAVGESKAFRGIDFADLQIAYRQFCKNEPVPRPAVDLGEVIDFYNKAAEGAVRWDDPDLAIAWPQDQAPLLAAKDAAAPALADARLFD